jgi:very-short-patch-repair endonuclease
MPNTAFARILRERSTEAERTVWRWLRNRTMFNLKFRRQHPVDRYILDFYCAELQLCIELDGGVHNEDSVAVHDAQRDDDLARLGITVVRIENRFVFQQPTATWEFIVGEVVKLLCARTGRSEADVLRELHTTPRGALAKSLLRRQWHDPSP